MSQGNSSQDNDRKLNRECMAAVIDAAKRNEPPEGSPKRRIHPDLQPPATSHG
jgi:hypothetical protein